MGVLGLPDPEPFRFRRMPGAVRTVVVRASIKPALSYTCTAERGETIKNSFIFFMNIKFISEQILLFPLVFSQSPNIQSCHS